MGNVVKKVYMLCPLCDKKHEVEERKRMTSITIKGEKVTYEERFCFCADSKEEEEEFETASMTNENLLNARNAYRVKCGLLTSDEIVDIRERYGLSQVDLAKLLGWGEATISRYESKAIQDQAYDTMLRLVRDDPFKALEFLKKNEEKFSDTKRDEIHTKMTARIAAYGKEYLSRQALASEYVNFDVPSEYNGFASLNIDKIEASISYMAAKGVEHLYKAKLMKLLWYFDALSYRLNQSAVTGLVYRNEKVGVTPVGHYSLMNLDKINVHEETGTDYETVLHIYPNEGIDYTILNSKERDILDKIILKFKHYHAKEMMEYMHEEPTCRATKEGEIIPFDISKEIRML
ncbi:MAG: DUF4065 domain-containing protein [Lachnospiraceae bacterium]|nr:DUF4065 domain-containing protein [Lachnospiraceae bacterium]